MCGQCVERSYYSFAVGETGLSGILCLVLDALFKADAEKQGKVQQSATKTVRGLEHIIYGWRLRERGLSSLNRKLMGNLTTT